MSAAGHYIALPARTVSGIVRVPGDKSISHRALMLGGIAEGTSLIRGFLASDDCLATLRALRALGVAIEERLDGTVLVHGRGSAGLAPPPAPLDMGNAGTAMRLFMGLLAGAPFDSTLIGDASLMRRPMERVAAPLRAMGARVETLEGRPPVRIHGGAALRAIDYRLPVASAQVKSALLLAALAASGTTRLTEPAITRDHTERMLAHFGATLERHGPAVALAGGQRLRACEVDVPGDFSSAAFFLVAGCLGATTGLTLTGVGINPTRSGLIEILRAMGADIRVRPAAGSGAEPIADIEVRAAPLHGIRVPESLVSIAIDEFPILFVAAAAAEGETLVTGAGELRVKESDRLAVMAEGLAAIGVDCELTPDGIRIQGAREFRGARIDSHGDHRVAMSFAVASLRAAGPIEIADTANVSTSFPGFPELARRVGLRL